MSDLTSEVISEQVKFAVDALESGLDATDQIGEYIGVDDNPDLDLTHKTAVGGAELRQLHSWLKEHDLSFGGLERVQNKQGRFLWVHKNYTHLY